MTLFIFFPNARPFATTGKVHALRTTNASGLNLSDDVEIHDSVHYEFEVAVDGAESKASIII